MQQYPLPCKRCGVIIKGGILCKKCWRIDTDYVAEEQAELAARKIKREAREAEEFEQVEQDVIKEYYPWFEKLVERDMYYDGESYIRPFYESEAYANMNMVDKIQSLRSRIAYHNGTFTGWVTDHDRAYYGSDKT